MAKNDFDIDFDFEEEYGFDPKAFLGTEEYDENIDLTEFSDEELGLKDPEEEVPEEDFDPETEDFSEEEAEDDEELPFDPLAGFPRESFAAGDPPHYEEQPAGEEDAAEAYEEEEEIPQEPQYEEEESPRKARAPKPKKPKKEFHTPRFIEKFYDLYFAPLSNRSMLEEPQDPSNPRRRRRKSRSQIFKEVYLPPILVCACAVLVLSFLMGAVSNAISQYKVNKANQEILTESSSNAVEEAEQAYQRALRKAETLAMGYDYDGAIAVLTDFQNDPSYSAADHPEIAKKSSEYAITKNSLVEYADPSTIPNLSFHVLINDFSRAQKNTDLWGKYNRNFVSTQEFSKILEAIYANGYVLVDFDSFIQSNTGTDGKQMFFDVPIRLPQGKKPIMLTETMVNYFHYMISDVENGDADANGDGFASKLVVQNGEIKAEYVDATGATLVGDYDFVPILETFIKAHPDFVYQGARATLAVTGKQGVFGYRTNTSYHNTKGQAYYEEQVAKAKEVAQVLRDTGYRIACFTYGNVAYKQLTANQIREDLTNWTNQIATPVLGTVDTLVFAQTSNISEYSGTVFDMLYSTGFRFFVSNGSKPSAEVNASFVKQNRLMVTGNSMAWHKQDFEGIFDCNTILDTQSRGNVPND